MAEASVVHLETSPLKKRPCKHFSGEEKQRILNIFKVGKRSHSDWTETEKVNFTAEAAGKYNLEIRGKRLTGKCRELVMELLTYFKQERDNKGPLLPITAVNERVSDALGISLRMITRIAQESQRLDINNQNANTSVTDYEPRQKLKTEDVQRQ